MNWFPSPGRLLGLWLLFVCSPLVADTVVLTDGNRIDGKVLVDGEKSVVVQIGDPGTMQIRTDSPEQAPAVRDKKDDTDKQKKTRPDLPLPQSPPKVDLPAEIPELSPKRLAQVKLWVYELQRQRSRNRTRAERSLGQVGPGVIPHLLPVARSPFDLARISALRLLIKTPHFKAAKVGLEGLRADNQWVRKLSWQLLEKISGVKGPFSWQDQGSARKRSVQLRRWQQWFQQQERLQQQHQRWLEQQAVQRRG
ncbi:MAG: hypothetical protein VX949_01660 [Planctomycetota bacterium]|nr:hypothetical protein [Planctomycetota bacterium]